MNAIRANSLLLNQVTNERFDVIVAGAGPAGCATATLLAKRGRRVLLLDQGVIPHPKLCTHAMMPAGLPVLREMGVLEQIEAAGAQRWWGVRLTINGTPISARFTPPRRGCSASITGHGLSLRRALLDPILLSAAQRQPLVTVLLSSRVVGLLGKNGAVTGVRVASPEDATGWMTARLVVAAGGRRSVLARAARLPERGWPSRHTALIAYVDGVPTEPWPHLEGFYHRGRSASLLPADHGLRVAGVMAPVDRWPRHEWPARMMEELSRYPGLRDRLQSARLVTAPAPVRGLRNLVRLPARPGFAAVGDAALQTDPAFGQGIAHGLRSGAALAAAADAALSTGNGPLVLPPLKLVDSRDAVVFPGISLLSLLSPGSTAEQLLAAMAASSPRLSSLALHAALRFAQ